MDDVSHLEKMPQEVQYNILSSLKPKEVLKLCQTNKYFSYICNNYDFWVYRSNQEFGVSRDKFNDTKLSPSLRYLQLLSTIGNKCIPGSERFANIGQCLFRSARDDDLESIDYFVNLASTRINNTLTTVIFQKALEVSSSNGNLVALQHIINQMGISLNQIDLDNIISKNINGNTDINVIKYLNSLNPTSLNNSILEAASKDNYILKYLINNQPKNRIIDNRNLSFALYNAIKNHNEENVDYLISIGASPIPALVFFLDRKMGNFVNFKQLFEEFLLSGLLSRQNINNILYTATLNGDYAVVDYINSL